MAEGNLRIQFVSFTDADTYYEADAISGSADPADRIFLEATNLPQDEITFEADDSGLLMPFRGSDLGVLGGKVLSGSSDRFLTVITGAAFASTADTLLASSITNFQKLYAISTEDVFFDRSDEFQLSINRIDSFRMNDSSPIPRESPKVLNVDKIESLFQDRRLSHLPNFKYLPPINKPDVNNPDGTSLGQYAVLGERKTELTYPELLDELKGRPYEVVEFARSSYASNVMGQFFEQSSDTLKKLDVIDFGEFVTTDPDFPSKHVFFVGKVFVDSFGSHTFVNMFTLIFE